MKIILCLAFFTSNLAFALPTNYLELKAAEKQEILFNNVSKDPYTIDEILESKDPSIFFALKLLSTTYLAESFTNPNDVFEGEKTKVIHTYGSVAQVEFQITQESPYTGLFKTGALGVIRMSLASLRLPYTPGFALKLLVDGKKSQNAFAMYSLDGQGDNHNFFENSFETKIDEPNSGLLKAGATRFKLTLVELGSEHEDPTFQSTKDLAKVKKNGEVVKDDLSPFSLVFEPTKEAQMSTEKSNLRVQLTSDPKYSDGLVLYRVFARKSEESEKLLIGRVVLKSRFFSSRYGDKTLYFQHNID